jgi:hypothetical protein
MARPGESWAFREHRTIEYCFSGGREPVRSRLLRTWAADYRRRSARQQRTVPIRAGSQSTKIIEFGPSVRRERGGGVACTSPTTYGTR